MLQPEDLESTYLEIFEKVLFYFLWILLFYLFSYKQRSSARYKLGLDISTSRVIMDLGKLCEACKSRPRRFSVLTYYFLLAELVIVLLDHDGIIIIFRNYYITFILISLFVFLFFSSENSILFRRGVEYKLHASWLDWFQERVLTKLGERDWLWICSLD
jgi:hypothetical protein